MNLLSPLEINKNYELQALSNEAVFGDAESSYLSQTSLRNNILKALKADQVMTELMVD
jgi:hypothetical protein